MTKYSKKPLNPPLIPKIVIQFLSKTIFFAFYNFRKNHKSASFRSKIAGELFRRNFVGDGQLSVVERIDHSSISSSFWGLQQQHSKRNPRTKHEKLHYKNVINHATYINYHCSSMGPIGHSSNFSEYLLPTAKGFISTNKSLKSRRRQGWK